MMKVRLNWQAPKKKWLWLVLVVMIVVIDQLTKHWAVDALVYAQPQSFMSYFNFTLLYNYGAAFSFLADAGGWQRHFFTAVAAVVSAFLLYWILCVRLDKKVEITGLSLILAGALGNLWDRISLGYVVDFVDWFYITSSNECLPFFYSIFSTNSCHWPVFNIADASILLGAILLIVDMLFYADGNEKTVSEVMRDKRKEKVNDV